MARPGRMRETLLLAVLVCLLPVPCAHADDIDDAAALPADKAVPALEALLDAARKAGDGERLYRVHEVLGEIHMRRGEPYAALEHFEGRLKARGRKPADRIAYAQALLAVAKSNIASGGMGRQIQPFLRDALDTVKDLSLARPVDGKAHEGKLPVPPPLRAALALVVVEAHYLLGDMEAASAALAQAHTGKQPLVGGLPEGFLAPLRDLRARVRYAQRRYADAAQDWLAAGNLLGAAAAFDAARMPEKSMPIYADRIRAAPHDAALIARALAGARFTRAQGTLLGLLDGLEPPAGKAGVPLLLARASLLEDAGRAREALAPLREAAARDEKDERALVDLGRLLVVTGDKADEATWDAAADAYIEAIRRRPASERAALGLQFIARRDFGRLWRVWRNPRVRARCVRVQQAVVAADPEDAVALGDLGNILRVLGRHEESLAAYARAREANPFDPGVESDAGLALSGAGRDADALAAYERSLELDPGHLAGRQNAARAHWLAGRDDAATAHLGAAVRTARAVGRSPGTYRFLLERMWRTRRDPTVR